MSWRLKTLLLEQPLAIVLIQDAPQDPPEVTHCELAAGTVDAIEALVLQAHQILEDFVSFRRGMEFPSALV